MRARQLGRRVHSCSLGSLGRMLVVVVFFGLRCVNSGAPWGSSSSFVFVEFIMERSGDGRVNSGS